jgi:REP-associated tyrosine transposase
MPSPPRNVSPGLHHIWVNATDNWAYYHDEADRLDWIRLFVRVARRHDWTAVAFCQLTTHVHAIVAVPDPSLPAGMQYLNREYSRDFNGRHGREGYLVKRRYGSRRIEDGADLLRTYPYVVLNAEEAGVCGRTEDWRWSSLATTLGLTTDFLFIDASVVLGELGGSRVKLRELIEARRAGKASNLATSGI